MRVAVKPRTMLAMCLHSNETPYTMTGRLNANMYIGAWCFLCSVNHPYVIACLLHTYIVWLLVMDL